MLKYIWKIPENEIARISSELIDILPGVYSAVQLKTPLYSSKIQSNIK